MLNPRTTTGVAPSRSSSGMNPRPSSSLGANQPERVRRDVSAVVAFGRCALLADVERRLTHQRDVRKALRRLPPIEEVVVRHAESPAARVLCPQRDDLIGIRERNAAQKDGVDEREDGAVGADAERKREDGDSGHPSPFDEHLARRIECLGAWMDPGSSPQPVVRQTRSPRRQPGRAVRRASARVAPEQQ